MMRRASPSAASAPPSCRIEKLEEGNEGLRALRALEEFCGRKVDALIAGEIGGGNALEPILAAASAGIGIVDGDGMGRAFPEMQMTTFSIYGQKLDSGRPCRRAGQCSARSERRFGPVVRTPGALGGGDHGRHRHGRGGSDARPVRETGRRSRHRDAIHTRSATSCSQANRDHVSAIPLICAQEGGIHLMDAKIVDLKRHLRGGFSVGEVALEGIDAHAGTRAGVVFQNEFLTFKRGGVVEVCVPDLIVMLDADTGHAITTDVLRYGQRVAVLAMPCHPLLRTPNGRSQVVGPRAFGLDDVEFRPLARSSADRAWR